MAVPSSTSPPEHAVPVPSAPAEPLAEIVGSLYVATSQALANAVHNATEAQQQGNVTMQAATVQGVMLLYSTDTASEGIALGEVMGLGPAEGIELARQAAAAPKQAAGRAVELDAAPGGEVTYANASALMRAVVEDAAAALHALGDVAVRHSIAQIQLAAVTTTLNRAVAIDPAAPNAAEQVKLYEDLLHLVIREMSAWGDSLKPVPAPPAA
jgi:hypothetical protein